VVSLTIARGRSAVGSYAIAALRPIPLGGTPLGPAAWLFDHWPAQAHTCIADDTPRLPSKGQVGSPATSDGVSRRCLPSRAGHLVPLVAWLGMLTAVLALAGGLA
jgi:hypothetical protein